jgi:hypothetical protein
MKARLLTERIWLRGVDHALPLGGLALIVSGWPASPLELTLGWIALSLAFFAWVAEADGIPVPRPGRAPIQGCGCWETPLAFTVRHRDTVLLFTREDDPEHGGWSDVYAVHQRPKVAGVDPRWELPLVPGNEWSLRGRAPLASLRFEHHERVSYVQRGSLERVLAAAGI